MHHLVQCLRNSWLVLPKVNVYVLAYLGTRPRSGFNSHRSLVAAKIAPVHQ